MLRALVIFMVLGIALSAPAQTLVISDIDDTIKVSHVLDTDDALRNLPRIANHFTGMADSYRALQAQNPSFHFVYLSNGIRLISEMFHGRFLEKNNFPSGTLYLREKLTDSSFKVTTIRHLIASLKPQELIMIGDNGEKDVDVYAQIRAEYPQIQSRIYIHQIYTKIKNEEMGRALYSGQKPFVTSVDLIADWVREGLVDQAAFQDFMSQVIPKILKEDLRDDDGGERAFPTWLDCRDYFNIQTPRVPSFWDRLTSVFPRQKAKAPTPGQFWQAYQQVLIKRCSLAGDK